MRETAAVDASALPVEAWGSRAPIWWGQLGMMAIETTIFALLLASYIYVATQFHVWPPPNISPPDITLSTVGLIILLTSCIPMYLASDSALKGERSKVILYMVVAIIMALAFLGIRWAELLRFNFKWRTDIFGSLAWCTIGLHTMHVIADTIQTIVLLGIVLTRRVGPKQISGIEVDGLYWYAIVAWWVPVWAIFYAYPHFLKG